jgi:hypothetical protein
VTRAKLVPEPTVFAGRSLNVALAAEGWTACADRGYTCNATVNDEDLSTCERSNVRHEGRLEAVGRKASPRWKG